MRAIGLDDWPERDLLGRPVFWKPPMTNLHSNQSLLKQLCPPVTILRLLVGWGMVLLFALYADVWLAQPMSIIGASVAFAVLFGSIIFASFGVVNEADHLAHALGEPYGTLILTLSIVLIEVILIATVLMGPGDTPTIGKDAIFSVMMIIMNLVMGLGLWLGGRRYGQQAYNAQGAQSYLAMIVLLTGVSMVLPNFTSGQGQFSSAQALVVSAMTLGLYGAFLWGQIGRYKGLYQVPVGVSTPQPEATAALTASAPISRSLIVGRSLVLVLTVLPIVLLAHHLAIVIDFGIHATGAPIALSGVLIAIIVFTPESITAVKAALSNDMTRAVNLCLGAFVSTVGLTIPTVLVLAWALGKPLHMGLTETETVLLVLTIGLSLLSFAGQRTHAVLGLIHLSLFVMFGLVLFVP